MKKKQQLRFLWNRTLKKSLRVMKLTCLLLLVGILHVSAGVRAQEGAISLNVKDASVTEVFDLIEQSSNYTFMYNNELIANLNKVSISGANKPITEILNICLKNSGLSWKLIDNVIVLNRAGVQAQAPEMIKIEGVVKDKTGEFLPGVSVLLKGTTLGAATDIDGKFTLSIPEGQQVVLVFSFVGMKTKEVPYKGEQKLTIVMEEDAEEMEEVVVNGYFTKNKSSFTGNVVAVTKDELAKVSSNNLLTALQVFDPSFRLKENTELGSNPNSLPNFRIRGNSGFGTEALSESNLKNDPNLPTFILDGYEVSVEKIFDLNMDRVESVTILKDASATAIYGSRAANGVVVVTTKAPKSGELTVSYSLNLSVAAPDLSDYHLLDAKGKLEAESLAGRYTHSDPKYQQLLDLDYAERYKNVQQGIDTYWLSQPLRTAVGHRHTLYVEGGDEAVRYGIDLSYQGNPGVMKESARDRVGLGFVLSYNLNDKFLFRNKLSVDKVKSKESPYGTFREYAEANPYYSPYNADGKLQQVYATHMAYSQPLKNPLYEASLNNQIASDYMEWADNFDIDWFINDHWRMKGRVAYTERRDNNKEFKDPRSGVYSGSDYQTGDGVLKKGRAYVYDQRSSNVDANLVLTYSGQFGNHFLNGALGGNLIQDKFSNEGYSVIGFPSGSMDYISFGKEFENQTAEGTEGVSRLLGAFLNVNYTWNNIYMVDVSGRLDGSSQFGSDQRVAPFWSAGIGWNVHNESFFESAKSIVNHLKLSFNVGSLGKASFEPYQAQTMFQYYKGQWYANGVGATLVGMGNKDLSWEKTTSYDANFEIQFLDSRISFDATYYYKKTKDLLSDITLPLSNGFETYKDNLGVLENKGYELSLRGWPIRTKDLNISLYATIAHNKNVIKEISQGLQSYNDSIDKDQASSAEESRKPRVQFKEGQSTTAIYAVRSLGINPANGKEVYLDRFGNTTYTWNALDKFVCGDTEPKVSGSFGLNGDYKGFNLSLNFLYQCGGQVYNSTLVDRVENANLRFNVDKRVLSDRWTKPGDKAFFKDIKDNSVTQVTSRFVEDENSLEMKSISLSYTFSKEMLKNCFMDRLKLTFMMEDLFRVANVKRERGLDYPFARTFNFGLQVQF